MTAWPSPPLHPQCAALAYVLTKVLLESGYGNVPTPSALHYRDDRHLPREDQ